MQNNLCFQKKSPGKIKKIVPYYTPRFMTWLCNLLNQSINQVINQINQLIN